MNGDKLEAFVDAVLAIILTVIVLELPQPATIDFMGFWALKTNFFSYLTSFVVILANWYFFHIIFSIVERIDGKVIAITGILLFVISLLPYFTILISNNFNDLNAQLIYCGFFIVIEIVYDVLFNTLLKVEGNHTLEGILNLKRTAVHLLIYIVGIMLAYYMSPAFIAICVLVVVSTWFIHVYHSIR